VSNRWIAQARRAALLAAAVLLVTSAANIPGRASAQSALIPMRIATIPSEFAAEVYYAKELGYFEKAGLDVQITPVQSGPAIVAALMGGAADIGYSNILSLLIARDKGLALTIVMPANLYEAKSATIGILAVTKNSPIRSGKDFNGKTVAINGLNSMPHLGARNWIDKNGGDSASVHFIEIPFSNMGPALLSGRIDASGSFDTTSDPDLGKPGDAFRLVAQTFDSVSLNFVSGAWFSSEDFASTHADATKRFIIALKQAAVWANTHHHESAVILAKYLNVPPETYENTVRTGFATGLKPETIKPIIDLALRYGVIKAAIEPRSIVSSLVPQ
jgi:NitT/TauT family transport system substrate-binding protein